MKEHTSSVNFFYTDKSTKLWVLTLQKSKDKTARMKTMIFLFTLFITGNIAKPNFANAETESTDPTIENSIAEKTQPSNTLWGFRCVSEDNSSVSNIAIQNNRVISVIVVRETGGQIISTRGTLLKEVSENRFAGPNYDMTFKAQLLNNDDAPKVEAARLTDNGATTAQLDCMPIYQKRTSPSETM